MKKGLKILLVTIGIATFCAKINSSKSKESIELFWIVKKFMNLINMILSMNQNIFL